MVKQAHEATPGYLRIFHELELEDAKRRLRAAEESVRRQKDTIRHHEATLRRLHERTLFDD